MQKSRRTPKGRRWLWRIFSCRGAQFYLLCSRAELVKQRQPEVVSAERDMTKRLPEYANCLANFADYSTFGGLRGAEFLKFEANEDAPSLSDKVRAYICQVCPPF